MPESYTYHIACSGLAASGAVSSGISSLTVGICEAAKVSEAWTKRVMVAAGGLSGGAASKIAGGDFWDGLCNGLICVGLNHAMHLVAEGVLPDDPPEKEKGSGIGKAAAGAGAATASKLYYSKKYKTWMGKNFKIYKQTWGGNGATGGKLKFASKVSKWFDGIGKGLGAHNAYQIYKGYRNGDINFSTLAVEEISNTISTLGGVEGAAWGIGWELGRWVTNMEWYQEMRFNILYNDFEKHFGPPSPTNEQIWYERFYNQIY